MKKPQKQAPNVTMKRQKTVMGAGNAAPPEWQIKTPADCWHKCVVKCFKFCCKKVAESSLFSALTTLLTIYALFGDDLRLLLFSKAEDDIFDTITISCMAIFSLEITAFTFGKVGYTWGFFFWLDILATTTLVLDVTTVSELLFGDSISDFMREEDVGASSAGGGSSQEAAHAAKMSRVGTKAGRVVRLIRLLRLIRLIKHIKCYKKGNYQEKKTEAPGEDWEEEDEAGADNESAVSKKLSELTTRKVILLVLIIMIALPFFQATFYVSKLETSAQSGLNNLFRIWRDGLDAHSPLAGTANLQQYFMSKERQLYIDDFYSFVYYHNPLCIEEQIPESAVDGPLASFGRMFWVGASDRTVIDPSYQAAANASATITDLFLPRFFNLPAIDLNERWNGESWAFYQCNMTSDPRQIFDVPWNDTKGCLRGAFRGVSILLHQEAHLDCPENLRYQERAVFYPSAVSESEWEELFFMMVFDRRSGSRMEAGLNVAQTLFICLLLGAGALTFSNDANKYVLTPIERIIANIDKIRKNPLAAMTIGDEENRKAEMKQHRKSLQRKSMESLSAHDLDLISSVSRRNSGLFRRGWNNCRRCYTRCCAKREEESSAPEPMETVVLEKTIIKIGSLLALGFGEAGAGIIAQNMKGGESSALNTMMAGRKVEAIFGLCNVRNFTEATEALQDQVMVFVNQIADLVHSCVNEFLGSPNHNIGDAFLLTWILSGHPDRKRAKLADMALISSAKLIGHVSKSATLQDLANHPKLQRKVPGYKPRLGFGLHSGWAIEGAIGSEFKIDASYLSNHIKMATCLEQATKHYKVLILLTDTVHTLLTEGVSCECRRIDVVEGKGCKGIFSLFTLDTNDGNIEVNPSATKALQEKRMQSKGEKFRQRMERRRKKAERWADDFTMADLFERDVDIMKLRSGYSDEFFARFQMAFLNYEAGEWDVAKTILQQVAELHEGEDGPSIAMGRFMDSHGGEAPANWAGHRPLPDR